MKARVQIFSPWPIPFKFTPDPLRLKADNDNNAERGAWEVLQAAYLHLARCPTPQSFAAVDAARQRWRAAYHAEHCKEPPTHG